MGALPYAVPLALGLACLGWSAVELVSAFTRDGWVLVEAVPALVVSSVGSGLLLFGSIGALSHALRVARGTPSESESPAR